MLLHNIIKLCGMYNILYGLSVSKIIHIPFLNNNHTLMLSNYDNNNPLFERFYGYWIFTYGIIRISNSHLTSTSFLIEAIFIANECFVNKTIPRNTALPIIISSLYLGYMTRNF